MLLHRKHRMTSSQSSALDDEEITHHWHQCQNRKMCWHTMYNHIFANYQCHYSSQEQETILIIPGGFWNQRGLNSGSDSWAVLQCSDAVYKTTNTLLRGARWWKVASWNNFRKQLFAKPTQHRSNPLLWKLSRWLLLQWGGEKKAKPIFSLSTPKNAKLSSPTKIFPLLFLGCFSLEIAKAGKTVEGQLSPVHCSFPFSYLAFLLHLFPQIHLDTPPPSSVSLTPRQGQQYLSSDAVLTVRPGLVEVQSELWLPCLFDSEKKYPNYVKDWGLMFSSCPPTRSRLIPLLLVRSPLLYFLLPPSPYTPLRGRTVYSLRFNSPKHGNLLWQKALNEEAKQQTGHVVWKFSQSLWPNCDL